MKARIKETGEILEVTDLYDDGTAYATNGSYYKVSTLDFDSWSAIDWEQRRYEIARDMLASMLADTKVSIVPNESYVESIIQYADMLIKKLKEG